MDDTRLYFEYRSSELVICCVIRLHGISVTVFYYSHAITIAKFLLTGDVFALFLSTYRVGQKNWTIFES